MDEDTVFAAANIHSFDLNCKFSFAKKPVYSLFFLNHYK